MIPTDSEFADDSVYNTAGTFSFQPRTTFNVDAASFGFENGHSFTLGWDLPSILPNLENIDFSSLDRSDIEIRNLGNGVTYEFTSAFSPWYTNEVTFGLTAPSRGALPDGNYRVSIVGEVLSETGLVLNQGDVLDFFVLAGDANRDRVVNLQDFLILRGNFNGSESVFSEGDFNYDGSVDLADFLILRSNFNTTV
ncbi:MAG: dockerin type I domain-containing protein [Planctomycetota bacterium]